MNEKEKIFLGVLDRHKGIIFKVANSYCQDASQRDDLIQEIILQLWLSIENYDNSYKWSTWIYRIALNTSISFYRKNRTRNERTLKLSPVMDMATESEDSREEEDLILLRQFIRELREIDRALILLYLDGLQSKEIAEIISISQTNVTSRISRIKKKLLLKFENYKKKDNA